MSGGHFNGSEFSIMNISDEIQNLIRSNGNKELDGWGYPLYSDFSPEVIEKFKEAVVALDKAYVYARRVDYLVSGDDGPETFLERLSEELKEVEDKYAK